MNVSSLEASSSDLYQKWINLTPQIVILGLLSIMVVLINAFVLLLFFFERAAIKTAHKYIISMTANDMTSGMCFVVVVYFKSYFELFKNTKLCEVTSTMGFFLAINNLSTILTSAVDRYWSIAFPIQYKMRVQDHSMCE